jgi:hypothetical protein
MIIPTADIIASSHIHIHSPAGGFSLIPIPERAVVLTVTVTGTALDPFKLAEAGFTVQVASDGAPLQVKLTVPDSPHCGVILRL